MPKIPKPKDMLPMMIKIALVMGLNSTSPKIKQVSEQ